MVTYNYSGKRINKIDHTKYLKRYTKYCDSANALFASEECSICANNGKVYVATRTGIYKMIMYPKGQHFPLHHYSTTIKQYSSRNAYSYNIKYFVGNSNFCDFGGAFKAGKLSLPLKVK